MDGLNFRIPGDRLSPPRLFRQVDWRVINRRLEVEDDEERESSKKPTTIADGFVSAEKHRKFPVDLNITL